MIPLVKVLFTGVILFYAVVLYDLIQIEYARGFYAAALLAGVCLVGILPGCLVLLWSNLFWRRP